MQARRIHVAASRCGRDRIAMRAPPVRRREPCCVCARVAAAAKEVVRLEWKTACYYGPCFTYFFIAHSSATCGLFEFYVFFSSRIAHRPLAVFLCVYSGFFSSHAALLGCARSFLTDPGSSYSRGSLQKRKKSRFSLHVRYYSRTQSWSPGGVVGAWSARFTGR